MVLLYLFLNMTPFYILSYYIISYSKKNYKNLFFSLFYQLSYLFLLNISTTFYIIQYIQSFHTLIITTFYIILLISHHFLHYPTYSIISHTYPHYILHYIININVTFYIKLFFNLVDLNYFYQKF